MGDLLRGTIATRQFCRRHNIAFVLDIHKHPIHKVLAFPALTAYSQSIDEREIPFVASLEMPSEPLTYLFTNAFCTHPIDEEDKLFIRELLLPNFDVCSHARVETVYHFRFKDETRAYPNFQLTLHEGDMVCTNLPSFKEYVKEKHPYAVSHRVPSHVGLDFKEEGFKSALEDVIILASAKKIVSYSEYDWTSGFVQWIAQAFDIPLESNRRLL